MKTIDALSGLFLVMVGMVFCLASLDLGIGRINAPGPGLVPFGTGVLLIVFSVGTIFEARLSKTDRTPLFRGKRWGVVLSVLASLFLYALALDTLGFIVTTFLIMTLLYKISERQSWKMALGASVTTTAFAYFLFDYLLKCSFPRGFLGL